jgi:hypothetical protein
LVPQVTPQHTGPLDFNGSGILTPDGARIVAPMCRIGAIR